jgi:hypothetical protein
MSCTKGTCDNETNLNRGFYEVKCSNDQCDYRAATKPVDIDSWNTDAEYRNQVDNCPKCNSILFLTPRQSDISENKRNLKSSQTNQHNRGNQK